MNEKKVCFIICTNSDLYLKECLYYLKHLIVPHGYEIEILTIKEAKSMSAGYNEGMKADDAKYKVYMHQDVFILNRNFIIDILAIFSSDYKIGVLGMVGPRVLAADGVMWHEKRCGALYCAGNNSITKGAEYCRIEYSKSSEMAYKVNYSDYFYQFQVDGIDKVAAVDGLLIATAYDIEWREDLFDGWDFYDVSQCMEFRKRGYYVVVPKQRKPWCLHDDGAVLKLLNYDKYRKIFLEEYDEFSREVEITDKEYNDIVKEAAELSEEEWLVIFSKYYYVKSCINEGLEIKDINKLYHVLDYMGNEGAILIKYFSDMLRLRRMLQIIKVEYENNLKDSFITGVYDYTMLMEKYITTVFYLRRIEMDYVDGHKNEMIDFFANNKITWVAVYSILINETLVKDIEIICILYNLLEETAVEETSVKLLEIYSQGGIPVREIYYLLADYYLRKSAKVMALKCLERMPEPDAETVVLIQKMRDKIP